MGFFLLLFLLFVIVTLAFIGLGLGLAFLLNLLLPQIDLGTGTLISLVAMAATVFAFVQVSKLVQESASELTDDDEKEPGLVYVMPDLPPLRAPRRRRRR